MAQQNPAVLTQNLRFLPNATRDYSRSPSRSPQRKADFSAHELDPLLSNLSPDSTLNALTTTEAISPTKQEHDILSKSIGEASQAERALGIRAAVAAQKLREWCTELSTWTWPQEAEAKKGKGFMPPAEPRGPEQYLGSLPKWKVAAYDERVEEIKDGLEALNVDELKKHVLDAYTPHNVASHDAVPGKSASLSYIQLRDFTAVVTATIVQALPFLARLTTLLAVWDARLIVLWQVQSLLNSLRETRDLIEMSWEPLESEELCKSFGRDQFLQMREALADSVTAVGGKFDRALDTLEGRDDALPEAWIDDMDAIEADSKCWVVEAQRRVLYNEWVERNGAIKPPPPELLSPMKSIPGSRASPTKFSRAHSTESSERVTRNDRSSKNGAHGEDKIETEFPDEPPKLKRSISSLQESILRLRSLGDGVHDESSSLIDLSASSNYEIKDSVSAPTTSKPIFDPESGIDTTAKAIGEASRSQDNDTVQQCGTDVKKQQDDYATLPSAGYQTANGGDPSPKPHKEAHLISDHQEKGTSLKRSLSVQASVFRLREMAKHAYTGVESPVEAPQPRGSFSTPHDDFHTANGSALGRAKSFHNMNSLGTDAGEFSYAPHGFGTLEVSTKEPSLSTEDKPKRLEDTLAQLPRLQPPRISHKREISNISVADSVVSDAYTDLSNAEIMDASTAEVLGSPVFDPSPRRASIDLLSMRKPLLGPLQTSERSFSAAHMEGTNSASPESVNDRKRKALSLSLVTLLPKTPVDGLQGQAPSPRRPATGSERTFEEPISKATQGSINQIRNAADTGHDGLTSLATPFSPSSVYSRPAETPVDSTEEATMHTSERLPRPSVSSIRSPSSQYSRGPSSERGLSPPVATHASPPKTPPSIPRRSSKRKSRLPQLALFNSSPTAAGSKEPTVDGSETGLMNPSIASPIKKSSPQVKKSPRKTVDETLDEKISDILHTVPMKIRLATETSQADGASSDAGSRPEAPTPHSMSNGQSKTTSASTSQSISTSNSTRSSTPTPSLTLAPARASRNSRPSFSETDVRLYHLSRSGSGHLKDAAPMKLFVRLVGEDPQRVMVRVGGGWADLAEYLREYALHHGGSRRISGNQFDVQNLPNRRSISPVGPGALNKTPSNLGIPKVRPARPNSALDVISTTSTSTARPMSSFDVLRHPRLGTLNAAIDPSSPTSEYSATPTTPTTLVSTPRSRQFSSASTVGAPSSNATSGALDFDFGFNQPSPSTAPSYTPLGAAGPKPGMKSRAVSAIYPTADASDEKWVDDMVSGARRKSGYLAPTPVAGRKISAATMADGMLGSKKVSVMGGGDVVGESGGKRVVSEGSGQRPRPKSRIGSLEKIGGIKRVFLKRKESKT